MIKELIHSTTCWICGRDVQLRDCNIDEHGRAVHEECYIARMKLETRPVKQLIKEEAS